MQEATEAEPVIIQVVADTMRSHGLVVLIPMARPIDCGYAADLEITENAQWAGPLLPPKQLMAYEPEIPFDRVEKESV